MKYLTLSNIKNSFTYYTSSYVILNFVCDIFSLQQDCPNGRLTPAKFVDMYKMFFPSGNAEEFCDHVFRTFDMDKNGYIDFKVRCCDKGIKCLLLMYAYIYLFTLLEKRWDSHFCNLSTR